MVGVGTHSIGGGEDPTDAPRGPTETSPEVSPNAGPARAIGPGASIAALAATYPQSGVGYDDAHASRGTEDGGLRVAGSRGGPGHPEPGRRRRYGRRRGTLPVGECFVSRLGPANGEPFAALDDPDDGTERPRPALDTPLDDLLFVSLDCETTGQSPHRLVELGGVTFTMRGHIASFETLVHCTDRINPYARRLHGITGASLAGAPPPDAVLTRFRRFAAGSVLIEHSADAFDTRLIARTSGEDFDADNIDTSRLAGKLWDLRDTIGLERLCAELGVTHRQPHHALADAEATAACFLELVARGRERFGWTTLGDLLADGQPPVRPTAATTGDRRGRPRPPATATATATEGDAQAAAAPPRPRRRRGRRRRGREGAPRLAVNGDGPDAAVPAAEPPD
jgi:DNA polymerase III epsilon subunit-like protein